MSDSYFVISTTDKGPLLLTEAGTFVKFGTPYCKLAKFDSEAAATAAIPAGSVAVAKKAPAVMAAQPKAALKAALKVAEPKQKPVREMRKFPNADDRKAARAVVPQRFVNPNFLGLVGGKALMKPSK